MKAIVCMNHDMGIGYGNKIPWKSPMDMAHFRRQTIGKGNNAVVMGRNTFDSINRRALPKRKNIVLTRNKSLSINYGDVAILESSIDNILLSHFIYDEVFIVGGTNIYALFEPYLTELDVTWIDYKGPCDAYFPINMDNFELVTSEEKMDNGYNLTFSTYKKKMMEV